MPYRPYQVLTSETLIEWLGFRLTSSQVRLPDGNPHTAYAVRHPGAVLVLPRRADGSLILVEQYRHAPDCYLLEFPAGTLEPGEVPLACAQRELAEEVGQRAGQWRDLGFLYPAPGFCDERQHCFLAEDLEPVARQPEPDEFIEVRNLAVAELESQIAGGTLTDGKTLALFARARAMGLV
jgi:ADP-ribose diphosphatase